MKKLLLVFKNVLSFGIPLFIQMLTKAKTFDSIIKGDVYVYVYKAKARSQDYDTVLIRSGSKRIDLAINSTMNTDTNHMGGE